MLSAIWIGAAIWAAANTNYAEDAEFLNAVAAIREAALREAAAKCEYTIRNIQILKSDGETYETPRVQKIARGLVDVARQEILALIGEKK